MSFLAPPADPVGKGIGHFFGAMRIDAFRPAEEFKQHMDNWIETFRNAQVKRGEKAVLIPGDPERHMTATRLKKGIPLLPPVEKDLEEVGKKFGVKL